MDVHAEEDPRSTVGELVETMAEIAKPFVHQRILPPSADRVAGAALAVEALTKHGEAVRVPGNEADMPDAARWAADLLEQLDAEEGAAPDASLEGAEISVDAAMEKIDLGRTRQFAGMFIDSWLLWIHERIEESDGFVPLDYDLRPYDREDHKEYEAEWRMLAHQFAMDESAPYTCMQMLADRLLAPGRTLTLHADNFIMNASARGWNHGPYLAASGEFLRSLRPLRSAIPDLSEVVTATFAALPRMTRAAGLPSSVADYLASPSLFAPGTHRQAPFFEAATVDSFGPSVISAELTDRFSRLVGNVALQALSMQTHYGGHRLRFPSGEMAVGVVEESEHGRGLFVGIEAEADSEPDAVSETAWKATVGDALEAVDRVLQFGMTEIREPASGALSKNG